MGSLKRKSAFKHAQSAQVCEITDSDHSVHAYSTIWAFALLSFMHSVVSNNSVKTWIKHVFSCINIGQVPWEVLKTEAEGRGFQHLQRDLANVNALKKHVRSLLLHKN